MKHKKKYFKAEEREFIWVSYFDGAVRREPYDDTPSKYILNHTLWRSPKTLSDKKSWEDSVDQGVKPRLKRSPSSLPTNWDDLWPSRYSTRCWKDSHRIRKQWMKNL